jgi:hypothetical protein
MKERKSKSEREHEYDGRRARIRKEREGKNTGPDLSFFKAERRSTRELLGKEGRKQRRKVKEGKKEGR